jgi:hypothetical protein
MGVLMAMNGLTIQHDANHGAFSSRSASTNLFAQSPDVGILPSCSAVVNRIFGFLDDFIGGSALMWYVEARALVIRRSSHSWLRVVLIAQASSARDCAPRAPERRRAGRGHVRQLAHHQVQPVAALPLVDFLPGISMIAVMLCSAVLGRD